MGLVKFSELPRKASQGVHLLKLRQLHEVQIASEVGPDGCMKFPELLQSPWNASKPFGF